MLTYGQRDLGEVVHAIGSLISSLLKWE
jgi:hypothetical protein